MTMQIAVTGGRGLIGRAVVALARAQGYRVVSIDRTPAATVPAQPDVTEIEADLTDYAATEHALRGCTALIHLAAIPQPVGHPDHVVHNNNVVSSYNALRAAVELGITHLCQASSVNAIGASYSRWPRYDYFPLDEAHPTYNEDPYSLSKWICEAQADSLAQRHAGLTIASLRFSWVVPDRSRFPIPGQEHSEQSAKDLWGYTLLDAAARACLLAVGATFGGHEVFYIVAPQIRVVVPSLELRDRFFPAVPVRGDLSGRQGFFTCAKAARLLGWHHDE